jgi:hypothetical protein
LQLNKDQEIEAAFGEIQALKDKLAKENAYLEEEVRTGHNFGEIVGDSAALRRVLQQVETVAPTGSTVLIRGETGPRSSLSVALAGSRWPVSVSLGAGGYQRRFDNSICLKTKVVCGVWLTEENARSQRMISMSSSNPTRQVR